MLDQIITIYFIVDDLLKAIGHTEDIHCQISNAEVITTALVNVNSCNTVLYLIFNFL